MLVLCSVALGQQSLAQLPPKSTATLDTRLLTAARKAFVASNYDQVVALLEPRLGSDAHPDLLILLGQGHWRAGRRKDAARAWKRARAGLGPKAKLALAQFYDEAVLHLAWQADRIAVVRERRTTTERTGSRFWVEIWDRGMDEPWVQWPLRRPPTGLAWMARGDRLAVAGRCALEVRDGLTGSRLAAFEGQSCKYSISAVAGAARVSRFVTAFNDGTIKVWESPRTLIGEFRLPKSTFVGVRSTGNGSGHVQDIIDQTYATAVAINGDGTRVAAGGTDGQVYLFDTRGRTQRVLKGFAGPSPQWREMPYFAPGSLAFDETDQTLVGAYGSDAVTIWDLARAEPRRRWRKTCILSQWRGLAPRGARRLDFDGLCPGRDTTVLSPQGRLVAFWKRHEGLRVRRTAGGQPVLALPYLTNRQALALSDDAGTLAVGHDDGIVQLLDIANRKLEGTLPSVDVSNPWVSWSADGRVAAIHTSWPGKLVVWEMTSGSQMLRLDLPRISGCEVDLTGAPFSSDGRVMAVLTGCSRLAVWDVHRAKRLYRVGPLKGGISAFRFTPSGDILAVATKRTVYLRNAADGRVVRLAGHRAPVFHLAFSADGARLTTADKDGVAIVWDTAARKQLERIGGHRHHGRKPLAFTSDGSLFVTLNRNDRRGLRILNTRTGKQLPSPPHHFPRIITGVAFTPDGTGLLIGDENRGVAIWGLQKATWQRRRHLRTENVPYRFAVGPHGDTIVVWQTRGTVQIFNRHSGQLLATLRLLSNGHFVAHTPAGAFAGTDQGRRAVITTVAGSGHPRTYGWYLGWDRFQVSDLWPRAMAGEFVQPPGGTTGAVRHPVAP